MAKTIIVCGATGGLGGSVARHLLKEGWKVRGITRNKDSAGAKALVEAGAELASADYDDVASLEAAFQVRKRSFRRVSTEVEVRLTRLSAGRQRRFRRDQLLRIHAGEGRFGCREERDAAAGQYRYCG